MTVAVNDIITDVRSTLNDLGTTKRWSDTLLLGYLNSAQRQIALVRPDVSSKTVAVLLVPGTKQAIPADGLRLLDTVRNMGTNGTTPGYPIGRTDRKSLDAFNRGWHLDTPATAVKSFIYDDVAPTQFYVTPPVHGSTAVYAEIIYAVSPTDCALNGNIQLQDIYDNPIKQWMLHRALATELTSQVSQMNSRLQAQNFYQSLSTKTTMDRATSPNPPSLQPGAPIK